MKTMFEFDIFHEKEIEKVEVSTNEKGEEVKTTSKVKTAVPVKLAIKKPTRSLFDEAELFYGVRLSEGIKAGLLTRALLAKRFNNDGGVLSDEEQKEYNDLYVQFFNLQIEFQRLSIKEEASRTEEEKKEVQNVIEKMNSARERLQKYEMAQANLFEQTAENRARNKTIMWWVLQLSLIQDEDKKLKDLFDGQNYEEKLKKYDEVEEGEFSLEKIALQKLLYLISFWYIGRASSQEEFEKLLDALQKTHKRDKVIGSFTKNKLRLLFVEILKGYTLSFYKNNKIYFKHNTSFDSGDIDYIKEEFLQKAKKNGLPTEEEKEKYLITESLWSDSKNEEIKKLKFLISGLKQTKSKLFKNDDIEELNKQIQDKQLELIQLINEKKSFLGFTVEDYANKKINEYYIFNSVYKNKNLTDRFFSEEEFDELENKDVSEISEIYDKVNKDLTENNLKKIALSSHYLSLFNICDESAYNLYGKPIIYLTFYQMEVFGYARYFRNALSEAKHKPPDDYYENPDKLIEWLESSRNAEEIIEDSEKYHKNTEGSIATSIVGAKKEDLAKIGKDEVGVSLHKEADKKGGVLSMQDLMKIHGL